MAISQHIIGALLDPPGKTSSALQIIVNNKFGITYFFNTTMDATKHFYQFIMLILPPWL